MTLSINSPHSSSSSSSSSSPIHSFHHEASTSYSQNHKEPFNEQRMQQDLSKLLDYGNDQFKNSVTKQGTHLSSQLKKIVKGVEENQMSLSKEGLQKLRHNLSLWPKTDPLEYDNRMNDSIRRLGQEVNQRLKDPFLGMSHLAQTNAQLVNIIRRTHGDQLHSVFCRTVPDLRSHDAVKPETVEILSKALQQPFVKNFEQAEALVKRDPNTQFDGDELSLISEVLARLPKSLLGVLKNIDLKFIATDHQVKAYDSTTVPQLDLSNQMGLTSYKANTAGHGKELMVALNKNDQGDWALPTLHYGHTVSLLLNSLGKVINAEIGNKMLNFDGLLSNSEGFVSAWLKDRRNPEKLSAAYAGNANNDHNHEKARHDAFAEGFARAYFVGRTPEENHFTKWDNISAYFNNELIPKLDRVNRGLMPD